MWKSESDAHEFLSRLNEVWPTMNFTAEKAINNKLSFLDTLISTDGENLSHELFQKATHSGRYLPFTAHCESRIKWNIVRSETRRIIELCSSKELTWPHLENLRDNLTASGYPKHKVTTTILRLMEDRDSPRFQTPNSDTWENSYILKVPYCNEASSRILRTRIKKSKLPIKLVTQSGTTVANLVKRHLKTRTAPETVPVTSTKMTSTVEMEHRGSDVESVGSQEDARQAPMGFNPLLFSLPPGMLLQGGEEVIGEAFGDLSEEDEDDEATPPAVLVLVYVKLSFGISRGERELFSDIEKGNKEFDISYSLTQFMSFVTKHTYATAGGNFFLQKSGVGTGYHSSGAYSEVLIDWTYWNALENTPQEKHPIYLATYVDDSNSMWKSESDAHEFLSRLNEVWPTMNFTAEKAINNKLSFLDTLISTDGENLSHELFQKATHSGRYLPFTAHCESRIKWNIVRSETRRIIELGSSKELTWPHLENLRDNLTASGYPKHKVTTTILRLMEDRDSPRFQTPNSDTWENSYILKVPYCNEASSRILRTRIKKSKLPIKLVTQSGTTVANLVKRHLKTRTAPERDCTCHLHQNDINCRERYVVRNEEVYQNIPRASDTVRTRRLRLAGHIQRHPELTANQLLFFLTVVGGDPTRPCFVQTHTQMERTCLMSYSRKQPTLAGIYHSRHTVNPGSSGTLAHMAPLRESAR
eukprot:sb/3462604/